MTFVGWDFRRENIEGELEGRSAISRTLKLLWWSSSLLTSFWSRTKSVREKNTFDHFYLPSRHFDAFSILKKFSKTLDAQKSRCPLIVSQMVPSWPLLQASSTQTLLRSHSCFTHKIDISVPSRWSPKIAEKPTNKNSHKLLQFP